MDVLIQSLVQANFAPERIIPRASMAQYTTFRVGGVADVLVNIASADEIPVALSAAKKADVPVTIIGCGSNLLVRDGGIRGLVLRISSAMSAIRRVGDDLIAEAGAPLGAIAAFARDEGLCGMAELAGIPGTIGGGVVMNAGAYGTELAQVVSSVDCVSLHNGKPIHYSADKLDFSYRHSALMDTDVVVTQATLALAPGDPEAIRALPGIGPYTTAAIASIAFNLPVACIDANVERVIARVFDVDSPVKSGPAAARIAELARRILPEGEARRHNQAMMELGALVCGKKPRCGQCPLARFCTALHLGIVHERPVPGKKAEITPIEVVTGVLSSHDRVFVQKRLPQGAWGGLWEFPGGRVEPGETPEQAVVREFAEETGFTVRVTAPLGIIRHGYTTYRVRLHCFALELVTDDTPRPPEPPVLTAATACRWLERGELESLAMPAAHRKLADSLTAPKGPLLTAF